MKPSNTGETEIPPVSIYTVVRKAKGVSFRESYTPYQEPPKSSGLLTALVAGAIIALVAANIYLYVQIDHLRADVAKVRESLSTELSNLRDASSVTTASQRAIWKP